MRLVETTDIHDIECPYCKQWLDVEVTYEEYAEDCYGNAECPKCAKDFRIETMVVYHVVTNLN